MSAAVTMVNSSQGIPLPVIDLLDPATRDAASDGRSVEHSWENDVVDVAGRPDDFVQPSLRGTEVPMHSSTIPGSLSGAPRFLLFGMGLRRQRLSSPFPCRDAAAGVRELY